MFRRKRSPRQNAWKNASEAYNQTSNIAETVERSAAEVMKMGETPPVGSETTPAPPLCMSNIEKAIKEVGTTSRGNPPSLESLLNLYECLHTTHLYAVSYLKCGNCFHPEAFSAMSAAWRGSRALLRTKNPYVRNMLEFIHGYMLVTRALHTEGKMTKDRLAALKRGSMLIHRTDIPYYTPRRTCPKAVEFVRAVVNANDPIVRHLVREGIPYSTWKKRYGATVRQLPVLKTRDPVQMLKDCTETVVPPKRYRYKHKEQKNYGRYSDQSWRTYRDNVLSEFPRSSGEHTLISIENNQRKRIVGIGNIGKSQELYRVQKQKKHRGTRLQHVVAGVG